jgi:hypothetical protein
MVITMDRRAPPLPVRVDAERRQRWRQAAERSGLTLSAWVRQTLDTAAGLTPGGQATVPTSDAIDPATCPHPRDRRRHLPYGPICEQCGAKL